VTGHVDANGRALLPIRLKHPVSASEHLLDVWIDTGFTGELVLSKDVIAQFGLPKGPEVIACLADGSKIDLATYTCIIEWFGKVLEIEIIANQGNYPLLGVGLLRDHELNIDYRASTVRID
jgi:clan AA aspartic protease